MRIELIGGMGIGKTTLCHVLTEIGYNCILEDLGDNPFLAGQYSDSKGFRFPSQMWFAISKYAELQAKINPAAINVIDQAIINCRAYTNLLFKDNDDPMAHGLINQVFDYVDHKFSDPDLLIYLKASPENQMKRIHARNRGYELSVDMDYLVNLKSEIDVLLLEAQQKGQKIIEIDTDEIFLPNNHQFASELAEDIANRLQFCINPKNKKDNKLTTLQDLSLLSIEG
jgi:deoxyadenosine/deoxycytidine kinase